MAIINCSLMFCANSSTVLADNGTIPSFAVCTLPHIISVILVAAGLISSSPILCSFFARTISHETSKLALKESRWSNFAFGMRSSLCFFTWHHAWLSPTYSSSLWEVQQRLRNPSPQGTMLEKIVSLFARVPRELGIDQQHCTTKCYIVVLGKKTSLHHR